MTMRDIVPTLVALLVTWRRLRASTAVRIFVAAVIVIAISIVPVLWLAAAVLGRIASPDGCAWIAGIGPCP
jgi:hypothetical protein